MRVGFLLGNVVFCRLILKNLSYFFRHKFIAIQCRKCIIEKGWKHRQLQQNGGYKVEKIRILLVRSVNQQNLEM